MIHLSLLSALKACEVAGWTHGAFEGRPAARLAEILAGPHDWPDAGPYLLSGAQILDGRGRTCVALSHVPESAGGACS